MYNQSELTLSLTHRRAYLLYPSSRHLLRRRASGNTDPVPDPETLAITSDAWIPAIERLKGDTVLIRDLGAPVAALHGVVCGASLGRARPERTVRWVRWRGSGGGRGRGSDAVGVAEP